MTAIAAYREKVTGYFIWRQNSSVTVKIVLVVSFACFTGLLAQVRILLPWTPVPITGQTFAVLAGGFVIGKWGGASQILYVAAGCLGIPWFAGSTGGAEMLGGPTVGYLLGFIVAAFLVGYCFDTMQRFRSFRNAFFLVLFANFCIINGMGLLFLYFWLPYPGGPGISMDHFLMIHFLPFLPGGLIKVFLASQLAVLLYPQESKINRKNDCENSSFFKGFSL